MKVQSEQIKQSELILVELDQKAKALKDLIEAKEQSHYLSVEDAWTKTEAKELSNAGKRAIAVKDMCNADKELRSCIIGLDALVLERKKTEIELDHLKRLWREQNGQDASVEVLAKKLDLIRDAILLLKGV